LLTAGCSFRVLVMKKLRVGILFGGRNGEHEVSLLSAASVCVSAAAKDLTSVGVSVGSLGNPFFVVIGLLDVLAILEPDLSVAMLYTLLLAMLLFAGGVRIAHFVIIVALVWPRFATTSSDKSAAARASALENSVGLYRVVAGKREMIGFMEINVSGQAWHTLGIAAKDERLTIFFDGRELFVATDRRFPGPPGKVGLWTKADSMTWFESLKISSLN